MRECFVFLCLKCGKEVERCKCECEERSVSADCKSCGNTVDNCICKCPYCGERDSCECVTGYCRATGG